jgi:hypothetical protein
MSRTDAGVVFTSAANLVSITVGGVAQPGYPLALPSGLSLTAAAITFNHLGAATGGNVALQIAGGAQTLRVCVEAATGYAYDC